MRDIVDIPTQIELRLRDLHVRAWLAALHETAAHLVRGNVLDGRLRLYSLLNGQALIIMDWYCGLVTIRVPGNPEVDGFCNVQSALVFLDGVLESYIVQVHQTISNHHLCPAWTRSGQMPK